MNRPFVLRALAAGTIAWVLVAAACGGNVVVDKPPAGQGGQAGQGQGQGGQGGIALVTVTSTTTGNVTVGVAVGSTATATSSTATGLPPDCTSCAMQAESGPCSQQLAACTASTDCTALSQCQQGCGFGNACQAMCDAQFPGGVNGLHSLIQCAVCNVCTSACAGTVVFTGYCSTHTAP